MRYPNFLHVEDVANPDTEYRQWNEGYLVPARPLGHPSLWSRFKLAWLVFTGRADALVWPEEP